VEQLLTTNEVAELYRTSPATIRYWRHIGYGPNGRKVGRRVLLSARRWSPSGRRCAPSRAAEMQFCATVRRATREPAPDSAKLVPSFRRVGIEEGLDDGEIVFSRALGSRRCPITNGAQRGGAGYAWLRCGLRLPVR